MGRPIYSKNGVKGRNPAKKLPLVYSIIWFIIKRGLTEKIIIKLKFMHIF
jgi:hypothetical protein